MRINKMLSLAFWHTITAQSTGDSSQTTGTDVSANSTITGGLDDILSFMLDAENVDQSIPSVGPGQMGRSFMPGVSMILQNLQSYGCWCFFNDKHGLGKGQPVDRHDNHCMKYHHAVSCAKIEIPQCNPDTTTYNIQAKTVAGSQGDIVYDCETGNDACQSATCYAQSHFISLLLQEQLVHLNLPDYPTFSARTGSFDNSICSANLGPGRDRREVCCGTWKANTKKLLKFGRNSNRECCHKDDGSFKTYDTTYNVCCNNGEVKIAGTCS